MNRNIKKLRCILQEKGLCEEQLLGLAVGQFCPIGAGNSVKIDFAVDDLAFNVGQTTYSIDTDSLPAGVSAVVSEDGSGEITVDPEVYDIDAEPMLLVQHIITSESGVESTASNVIALRSLGGHVPNNSGSSTSPHCCFMGVCTSNIFGLPNDEMCLPGLQFRTRDECNEVGWCCDRDRLTCSLKTRCSCEANGNTWFALDAREECEVGCELVTCCQPLDNGLGECLTIPRNECNGDFYPQTGQGRFDCADNCPDVFCCSENTDCVPLPSYECFNVREGDDYSTIESCEESCEKVWCCSEDEDGEISCRNVPVQDCILGGAAFNTVEECLNEQQCCPECCLVRQITSSDYKGEKDGDTNIDAVGPPADEGGSEMTATFTPLDPICRGDENEFEVTWNIDLGTWEDWGDYNVRISAFIPPNNTIFALDLGQRLRGTEIVKFDTGCNARYVISVIISTSTAGVNQTGDLDMAVGSSIEYGPISDDSDCINTNIRF